MNILLKSVAKRKTSIKKTRPDAKGYMYTTITKMKKNPTQSIYMSVLVDTFSLFKDTNN